MANSELIGVCCVVLVTQSCLTLCDPMDYSPPGSSVHGILQERIPEWVVIPFSRASWRWNLQVGSLPSEPLGKPISTSSNRIKKENCGDFWYFIIQFSSSEIKPEKYCTTNNVLRQWKFYSAAVRCLYHLIKWYKPMMKNWERLSSDTVSLLL